ncbi:hypothetical protein BC829DRAFT_234027 [Chytridium lagenaria]|nr:hypothetical protein BC829DRAFT_234027 [Chytridium lagenaria]
MAITKRISAMIGAICMIMMISISSVSAGGAPVTHTTTATPPIPVPTNNANVLLRTHAFDQATSRIQASIWVKNVAYDKKVYAIYSNNRTNDWKTGASFEASFNYSIPNSNYELWTFAGSYPLLATTLSTSFNTLFRTMILTEFSLLTKTTPLTRALAFSTSTSPATRSAFKSSAPGTTLSLALSLERSGCSTWPIKRKSPSSTPTTNGISTKAPLLTPPTRRQRQTTMRSGSLRQS